MKTRPHGYWFFLLVSMTGAFISAYAFLAASYCSTPAPCFMSGWGHFLLLPLLILCDPFVFTFATTGVVVSGLLASPLLFFGLRRKRLFVALPIVFLSVLTVTVVLTWFSGLAALAGAYVALIISVVFCRWLPGEAVPGDSSRTGQLPGL